MMLSSDAIRRFTLKRIAAQAGVSNATVDRALHGRGQVHHQTQQRIQQALTELAEQESQGLALGRTLYIDVVMQAPRRFSQQVRQALAAELASLAPFRISPRYHLFESITLPDMVRTLQRCRQSSSQGIILKAPDVPAITAAVNELVSQHKLPVLTLVTDLPQSQRAHYIGMDNRAAGRTAAYLLMQWLGSSRDSWPAIAVVMSSSQFRGEEERDMGFRSWLREHYSQVPVVDIAGGQGIYHGTYERMRAALEEHPALCAVYSVGGGNGAILDAFRDSDRVLTAFIGHDLDDDNRRLLSAERMHAVIDHDLRADLRQACLRLLVNQCYLHASAIADLPLTSPIQVITPCNLPPG
jgi:LacI family transcriptional regulator